jgi:hypothetical protein
MSSRFFIQANIHPAFDPLGKAEIKQKIRIGAVLKMIERAE